MLNIFYIQKALKVTEIQFKKNFKIFTMKTIKKFLKSFSIFTKLIDPFNFWNVWLFSENEI